MSLASVGGSELEVFLVQSLHLRHQLCHVGIVDDDIISGSEACFPGKLGRNYSMDIFSRKAIPLPCAVELFFYRRIDNQNTINQGLPAFFQQQWHYNNAVGTSGICNLLQRAGMNNRVQQGFQLFTPGGIGEDDLPQAAAIQGTIGCDKPGTEQLTDMPCQGRAR